MNALQTFMAECNRQTRAINQEKALIDGATVYGTFGDPQMLPDMVREGYKDQVVVPFLSSKDQYASPPISRGKLVRLVNNQEYFIQMVDAKDPVLYTFILVDRQP